MGRRNYVVTYDISDDGRRAKVFRYMHGYGDHAQYSVFLCQLSDQELVRMRHGLRTLIHAGEDQILIVEVGRASRPMETAIDVVGRGYEPAVRSIVV